jgi:hypothetical protein
VTRARPYNERCCRQRQGGTLCNCAGLRPAPFTAKLFEPLQQNAALNSSEHHTGFEFSYSSHHAHLDRRFHGADHCTTAAVGLRSSRVHTHQGVADVRETLRGPRSCRTIQCESASASCRLAVNEAVQGPSSCLPSGELRNIRCLTRCLTQSCCRPRISEACFRASYSKRCSRAPSR